MEKLRNLGLSINEYLILYNIVNNHDISIMFDYSIEQLVKLERKGYLKLTGEIHIRNKTYELFYDADNDVDFFEKWLSIYPTNVKTSRGGSRALSPASSNTILGKTLKDKWGRCFKKNVDLQKKAIRVLELEVADKTRSGDLEFMVEATKWLNQGYWEKYEYLIQENEKLSNYENEDYY